MYCNVLSCTIKKKKGKKKHLSHVFVTFADTFHMYMSNCITGRISRFDVK